MGTTRTITAGAAATGHDFARLVRPHLEYLRALAEKHSDCRDDAEDAVQDALLRASRSIHGFREDCSIRTWLSRIVINACLDRMRSNRLRRHLTLDEEKLGGALACGSDVAGSVSQRLAIGEALASIPPAHLAALILVDVHGYSLQEAASALDVAVGTVKSRRSRARSRLAGLLGPEATA